MTMTVPADTATTAVEAALRDDLADYGARVELVDAETFLVEVGGMNADEFRRIARAAVGAGWGVLTVGRVDPLRPELAPHKTLWHGGVTGWHGVDKPLADVLAYPEDIAARIVHRDDRGILNIALRMPVGVIGLDVDDYGDKHGFATIATREAMWGEVPPTYRLTARGFADGSGIRLYRVPADFVGLGEIPGIDGQASHVELVQRHHRYAVAPGGLHHSGATYRLYDERTGATMPPCWLPRPDELPELPDAWRDGLRSRSKPRTRGQSATPADVAAFAEEYTFNQYPERLAPVVAKVRETGRTGASTRNAYRDAHWRAAHDAAREFYPWTTACDAIKAAAIAAYAERGRTLDQHDYDRSAAGAVTALLDADPYAHVADDEYGDHQRPARAQPSRRAYRPAHQRAYRPAYRPMEAAR